MTGNRDEIQLMELVNPCGRPQSFGTGAVRVTWPTSLRNVRVGFFGNGKSNVAGFLETLSSLLTEHGAMTTCTLAKEGPMADGGEHRYQDFQNKCDLVIVGVCDGGTAASIGAVDALKLADRGVPAVLVATEAFAPLARLSLPPTTDDVRMIVVPHPLSSLSSEETINLAAASIDDLIDAIAGDGGRIGVDPDQQGKSPESDSIDLPYTHDTAALSYHLFDLGWTDGLPVIAPTRERVDNHLAVWPVDKRPVNAPVIFPRRGEASPDAIAANAVMTGMPAQLLPYLSATLEAAAMPAFKLLNLQTTTNPVTPVVIVGGPNRRLNGFNDGLGSIGGGSMANATLGRALKLCMRTLGGARAEDGSDPATMGQPGKYAFCFAENEDLTPWPRLREQTRAATVEREDDAVTVAGVTGTMNMIIKSTSAEELLEMIARSIRSIGSNDYMFGGTPLLVLCPEHAQILVDDDVDLPTVQQTLFDRTKIPFSDFAPKNQEMMRTPRSGDLGELYPDTEITIVKEPADLFVCVTGGPSMHSTFMPSFGGSTPTSARVK